MGTAILRGISASLLVTVLTLMGGMLWTAMGLGGVSVSSLVDIGLLLSCLIGGFRTGKESGAWLLGGITGAGYVAVGAMLLALFLPLRSWGVLQVMLEGGLAGLIAGAIGAGGAKKMRGLGFAPRRRGRTLYDLDGSGPEEDWHMDDWLKNEEWNEDKDSETNEEQAERIASPKIWSPRPSSGENRRDELSRRSTSESLLYNYEDSSQPWWEEDIRKRS